MKILQFAFDGHSDNPYLPENYSTNTVVYTGTHDNDTTRGWFEALPRNQQQNVRSYLKRIGDENGEIAWELIRVAWSSVAALAMAPLQDVLNLGTDARMNLPGRAEGNWRWRCTEDMLSGPVFERLRELRSTSNRPGIFASPLDSKKT
jgi:4-alpha-glucanotransferase